MERVDITLSLPQDLAEAAKASGLLTEAQIERILVAELDRQQQLDRFFNKLDRLAEIDPPLTLEEIEAEIAAYKREKTDNDA